MIKIAVLMMLLSLMTASLTGCGVKGNLYLPKEEQTQKK